MPTKIKLNDCLPCISTHPGKIIKDELKARKMQQNELATLIGVRINTLFEIIKGRSAITPEISVLLQEILEIDASYWLSLQNQFDIDQANLNANVIKRKKNIVIWKAISRYCSVKSFQKLGMLGTKISENINTIFTVFNVASVEELIALFSSEKEVSYFKKSERFSTDAVNIFTWKHYAIYESSKLPDLSDFDIRSLDSLKKELNQLFVDNKNTIKQTKEILARYGIKFLVISKFDQTPIDGFSFWQGKNPTIVLTLRLNKIDNYASALLHEICHVYKHIFTDRDQKFIAIEGFAKNRNEYEADHFAKYSLISKYKWISFLKQHLKSSPHEMELKIKLFANQHNINEAIVLVFYKHDSNSKSMRSSIPRDIK